LPFATNAEKRLRLVAQPAQLLKRVIPAAAVFALNAANVLKGSHEKTDQRMLGFFAAESALANASNQGVWWVRPKALTGT